VRQDEYDQTPVGAEITEHFDAVAQMLGFKSPEEEKVKT
jgi:hypothetical protein